MVMRWAQNDEPRGVEGFLRRRMKRENDRYGFSNSLSRLVRDAIGETKTDKNVGGSGPKAKKREEKFY